MIKSVHCECRCHKFHLAECGECVEIHHEPLKEDTLTFTDSYVVDIVSEYLHRYAEPGQRLGDYYYEMIFSNMISGKITDLQLNKISYLNYLFKHRKQVKIFKLIHRGIIQFLSRNGKCDITRNFDEMGKLQWRINNET